MDKDPKPFYDIQVECISSSQHIENGRVHLCDVILYEETPPNNLWNIRCLRNLLSLNLSLGGSLLPLWSLSWFD